MPWNSSLSTRSAGFSVTATEWNKLVANLNFLAEVASNTVTSDATTTATTVGTAAQIIATSPASPTYENVPHLLEFYCPVYNAPAQETRILLRDSTTVIGTIGRVGASAASAPLYIAYRFTPSAAAHSYNIAAWLGGAGTGTFNAGTGGTAGDSSTDLNIWLRITRIPTQLADKWGVDWHPDAKRVVFPSAGAYVAAGKKILWHTTETKGLPAYVGTQPHFTLNPRTGELWQHQPISEAAKALAHPSGTVETNRAQVVQVELICYSDERVAAQVGGVAVPHLSNADYKHIRDLARWIEKNHGVKRKTSVTFKHYPESSGAANGVRLSQSAWTPYEGHLGHQHAPGNTHGDPSSLDIQKILAAPPPWKLVKDGQVFKKGSLREVRQWIKEHAGKVKKLGGINLRRNR